MFGQRHGRAGLGTPENSERGGCRGRRGGGTDGLTRECAGEEAVEPRALLRRERGVIRDERNGGRHAENLETENLK